jgi:hypothetical protein
MNRDDRTIDDLTIDDRFLVMTGSIAALLGVAAGVAEILAGTTSWAGNKNDPTTLGWVTIGLALIAGAAAVLACRSHRAGAQLAAAALLLTSGVVGTTTAGLAWIPAAIAALTACVMVVRRPRAPGAWRSVLRAQWARVLVVVLAAVYLTFGIVAGGGVGLLGVAGAGLACVAVALHRRSRLVAGVVLVLAAVPFAVMTAWTVVTPLTAVLLLAIGLPYVHAHSPSVPARGGSS